MRIVYDLEIYPNCFTFAGEMTDTPLTFLFEISEFQDDSQGLYDLLLYLESVDAEMVGFNNVNFDYPILHEFIKMGGKMTYKQAHDKCNAIIKGQKGDKFKHMVFTNNRYIKQIDLLKINHFDNKAKMTSLKSLEFNMRSKRLQDLPFKVGTVLTREQIAILKEYNQHDVSETKKFYFECLSQIKFREDLTWKHNRDFMNHSDVKIGAEIFQMALEQVGVPMYTIDKDGRKPRQTIREYIDFSECVPPYRFENDEFQRMWHRIAGHRVKETKQVFKDHKVRAYGIEFIFGTGGLHASVESESFNASDEMMILDLDVTSMYPSIAIVNNYYPEHLGQVFVQIYKQLKEQRVQYPKGSAENAMLKLALNGTYGASNNEYSVFYDPRFTMQVTITGQFALAKLVEMVMIDPRMRIIQANTDGITLYMPRDMYNNVKERCGQWELITGLQLEEVEYSKMIIADVNSYIAVKMDGKTKRKGRYEHAVGWHQDASALVIPKVAEMHLVHGASIEDTIRSWPDFMDFMLRVKVNRPGILTINNGEDRVEEVQNTTRYYVAKGGVNLVKKLPPLKGKTEWRKFNIQSGWKVCVCNKIEDGWMPIDYEYYIDRCEKLCLGIE